MLDLADKPLNQMPFSVAPRIIFRWVVYVFLGRDDCVSTTACNRIDELGNFPLALHLAGSYLQQYNHAVGTYLEKLQERDILNHPSLQGRGADFAPTEHDLHVARTFAMSFERLDKDDPIEALALHLLA